MTILQRWKQTSLANKAIVFTSTVVAVGTIFYSVMAACQVSIANTSARDTSAQIDKLVGATNSSIDKSVQASSKAISDTIQKNKESIEAALAQNRSELQESIRQAKNSLEASERQSKSALDLTIANTRADQRAWLGVHEARLDRLQENTPLGISIQFLNTGKTPALHVTQGTNFRPTAQFFQGPQPDWAMNFVDEAQLSVAPQGTLNARITLQPAAFNLDLIRNGRQWVYWYGRLRYADISGAIQGRTDFCVYVSVDAVRNPDIFFCNEFNNLQ